MAGIERLPHCKSCGVRLYQGIDVSELAFDVQDQMQAYCEPCARELLGENVSAGRPTTFNCDSGGGWRVIRETKTH
jgi:hypothetical protein